MDRILELPAVSDVVGGNTIVVRVPVGECLDRIAMHLENVTPAQLSNLRLEVNGNLVSEYKSGTELQKLNVDYFKRNTEPNRLMWDFNEMKLLKTLENDRYFALMTNGLSTVQIKADLAPDVENPVITAISEKTQNPMAQSNTPNWLKHVRKFHFGAAAAGRLEIDSLPKPIGTSIARIHIYKEADDVSKAIFSVDGLEIINAKKTVLDGIWRDHGFAPQPKYLTLEFIKQGDMSKAIPMSQAIQDMRLKLDVESAGQVELLVEYIGIQGSM